MATAELLPSCRYPSLSPSGVPSSTYSPLPSREAHAEMASLLLGWRQIHLDLPLGSKVPNYRILGVDTLQLSTWTLRVSVEVWSHHVQDGTIEAVGLRQKTRRLTECASAETLCIRV